MKWVALYLLICLLDVFYVGGAIWLVLVHGWEPLFTILCAIFMAVMSYPNKIIDRMEGS